MRTLDPRRHAYREDLADEALRSQVKAPRYVAGELRQVVTPSAPVRRFARFDAPLDTEALHGERVVVFDAREGWAWGQLETDGYVGYLPAEALGPVGEPPTHRVTALRTFVYPATDIKTPPLHALGLGSLLQGTAEEGKFLRIEHGGFVYAAHAAAVDRPCQDFVAVAERFLGTPYLWGGRTSLGLDCSGLLQLAMLAAGVTCPRDSDMQGAELGNIIDAGTGLAGLRRGDILCWKGHVAIMTGADRLVHSNGYHMQVVVEPVHECVNRIAASGIPLRAVRRPGCAIVVNNS